MEVITTHVNADFDGFASMVAAKRLYPEAELVFAGSQEKNVRTFLAQEFRHLYDFKKIKHIDLDKVTRLIVVDTRRTETADLADIFLQVKPGTDAFCLAAIGAILVSEGLVDSAFIDAETHGYNEVAAGLSAVDIGDFAERCGISVDTLRDTAWRIAAASSVAVWSITS